MADASHVAPLMETIGLKHILERDLAKPDLYTVHNDITPSENYLWHVTEQIHHGYMSKTVNEHYRMAILDALEIKYNSNHLPKMKETQEILFSKDGLSRLNAYHQKLKRNR